MIIRIMKSTELGKTLVDSYLEQTLLHTTRHGGLDGLSDAHYPIGLTRTVYDLGIHFTGYHRPSQLTYTTLQGGFDEKMSENGKIV